MRVRFARVGFHTATFFVLVTYPSLSVILIVYFWAVIFSIPAINMSEIIPIPRNKYTSVIK